MSPGRPTRLRACLPLLAAAVLAGCATKSDIRSLEQRMTTELEEVQAEQRAVIREIGLAFDSLSEQERRQLTGRGELTRTFNRLQDMIGELLELVNQNHLILQQLRQGGGAAGPGGQGAVPGPAGPEVDAEPGEGGATGAFAAAQEQFNRGAFETARGGFEDFLESYPDHELAPDAQFFVAETYARTGDRESALEEYRRIEELYPDSRRAPTALFRRAVLQLEQGNTSEARSLFRRIELGYPNSAEAELAAEQLRQLRP